MIEMKQFFRHDKVATESFKRAEDIAKQLFTHLKSEDTLHHLSIANLPGTSSSEVQNVFLSFAKNLGFRNECEGLFETYSNSGLRPDYFLPIGETGILLEVERGKTTINNMDILDFWKCHLCNHANYLFLLVPRELRQNDKMRPRREFNTVSNRMQAFFEPRNYTNVWGLWLFGY